MQIYNNTLTYATKTLKTLKKKHDVGWSLLFHGLAAPFVTTKIRKKNNPT